MKQFIGFFLLFFCFSRTFAQQIVVMDRGSNLPVSDARIFEEKSKQEARTDVEGKADLTVFSKEAKLFVSHPFYISTSVLRKDLVAQGPFYYLENDENLLSEIVISASKWQQDKNKLAQKIVSIHQKEIVFNAPQTAADLLEQSGQVFVQKSQLGGGSPMIRGFSTNRLLLTVDGVRMNTAIFRSGNVQNVISVDPFFLESTEVILGPGSVAYGSDAIGGVMNFQTLRPSYKKKGQKVFSANASVRYASANFEKTGHIDFSFQANKWTSLSSISISDYDDLRMGTYGPDAYLRNTYVEKQLGIDKIRVNSNPKIQKSTGFQKVHIGQKFRFKPSDTWNIDGGLHFNTTSNFNRYDRLIRFENGNPRAAEWFYGPQKWIMANLQAVHLNSGFFYDKMKLTAAYQRFEESRNDRDFEDIFFNHTEEAVDAYSFNIDMEKKFEYGRLVHYGAEYVANQVFSRGTVKDITTDIVNAAPSRYPNGSVWQSIGAYLNYSQELSEFFNFESGLRYSHVLIDAEFDTEFFNFPFTKATINTGAVTTNVGLNWRPLEKINWKLNVSTSFRAPNIDDIGKIFDSEPGAVVVPNPDLKSERAVNVELGVRLKPMRGVKLEATHFQTYLSNALVRRDFQLNGQSFIPFGNVLSRVQAIQNASESKVHGFESGLEIAFNNNWKLKAQYAIVKGYDIAQDGSKAPSRHVAPQFGNGHLIHDTKRWKLDAFVNFNSKLKFKDLAPTEINKPHLYASDIDGNPYAPSWYTLNFKAAYTFTENISATAALENISDQRYRTYSSGLAAAGRNLILALHYHF